MPTWVVLLRGINVGRAKRLAMAGLRTGLIALGYDDVRTHGQSGNIVLRADVADATTLAARIAAHLEASAGLRVAVIALPAAVFAAIVAANPLPQAGSAPSRFLVAFGATAATPALAALLATDWTPEAYAAGRNAAYLWCPAGILSSPLARAFTRAAAAADLAVTTRNWATVCKLAALLPAAAG